MTVLISIIGKSGSGKTTLAKTILNQLHSSYSDKSFLLVDTDLTGELGISFGLDIKNTIYDIKSGQFSYKSKVPQDLAKNEFVEWALQDIIVKLYDDIDMISSGYVSTKECKCFINEQINEALVKLIKSYDFVIADCEYDLEYLSQLIDYPPDVTLIVSDTSLSSVFSTAKIKESSQKLSSPGQLGLVLNKVKNQQIPENTRAILSEYDLDILGILPYDEELETHNMSRDSEILTESVKELLFRLNLPLV